MKIIVSVISAAVFCVGASAQTARFTLEDCLRYARSNSHTRAGMLLDKRSAELSLRQSQMDRLPSLNASASENLNHQKGERRSIGGSAGLSAGITLWQGGALNRAVEQDRLTVSQTEARTAQWDNTRTIDIMSSYFTIMGYFELLGYHEALIAAGEEQVRDGRERLKEGALIESDFMLLEAQLAQNKRNLSQTESNIFTEQMNLRTLMSMDFETGFELIAPDSTTVELPVRDRFVVLAEAGLPDRRLLDMGVALAESGLKISRAGYFPTLSASGSLGTGHTGRFDLGAQLKDRFSQSAGVSLSVPIFNRGRVRTGVEQSKIALQQAELERRQGELEIRQMLLRSYAAAEQANEDYRSLVVRENAYRNSLEAYRAMYAVQTIKTTDLLQQENNYINVMYDLVQGKYNLMLRRRILDVYMGV